MHSLPPEGDRNYVGNPCSSKERTFSGMNTATSSTFRHLELHLCTPDLPQRLRDRGPGKRERKTACWPLALSTVRHNARTRCLLMYSGTNFLGPLETTPRTKLAVVPRPPKAYEGPILAPCMPRLQGKGRLLPRFAPRGYRL